MDDSITIHYDIDIKTNKELINIFEGVLRSDNRRKGSITSIGEWIDVVRSGRRGHVADNANDTSNSKRSGNFNDMDGGSSESDTGRYIESGAKNDQHEGKASRELDSPEEAKEAGEISDANILPQVKVGKTLVKNGSYDVSVENATVCIRTIKQFKM